MTDKHVPSVSNFPDIYPAEALEAQSKRWNNLLSTFEAEYNTKADFVPRSPGRVNIIGEVRECCSSLAPYWLHGQVCISICTSFPTNHKPVAHRLLALPSPAHGSDGRRPARHQNP